MPQLTEVACLLVCRLHGTRRNPATPFVLYDRVLYDRASYDRGNSRSHASICCRTLWPSQTAAIPQSRIVQVWGGPETLIVISSDLSHYHRYEAARRLDAATATAIERGDWASLGPDRACGRLARQRCRLWRLDVRLGRAVRLRECCGHQPMPKMPRCD
jgi:hypothetical protein